jgi:hypothetical protein
MQKNEIQECVYFKTFSSPEQLTQLPKHALQDLQVLLQAKT